MISISGLFIRRPVMTVLTMLSILLFGLIGYKQLPVSDLPDVDFPTINVSASLPGASPATMASSVATVLEKEFSSIAGIDSMSSVSTDRRNQNHPPVFSGARYRFRRPGCPGSTRPCRPQSARRHAVTTVFSQVKPGGHSDPLYLSQQSDPAAACCSTSTARP